MQKHLANLIAFESKTTPPGKSWSSALQRWRDAYQRRKAERKREEILSELSPAILYDIGENDCRPPHRVPAFWEHDPYRLLMEAIMSRNVPPFDPRR